MRGTTIADALALSAPALACPRDDLGHAIAARTEPETGRAVRPCGFWASVKMFGRVSHCPLGRPIADRLPLSCQILSITGQKYSIISPLVCFSPRLPWFSNDTSGANQ